MPIVLAPTILEEANTWHTQVSFRLLASWVCSLFYCNLSFLFSLFLVPSLDFLFPFSAVPLCVLVFNLLSSLNENMLCTS
jgi:hypothetical protein